MIPAYRPESGAARYAGPGTLTFWFRDIWGNRISVLLSQAQVDDYHQTLGTFTTEAEKARREARGRTRVEREH